MSTCTQSVTSTGHCIGILYKWRCVRLRVSRGPARWRGRLGGCAWATSKAESVTVSLRCHDIVQCHVALSGLKYRYNVMYRYIDTMTLCHDIAIKNVHDVRERLYTCIVKSCSNSAAAY